MIGISNLTFSTKAAIGTVVGTLSLYNASLTAMGANFMLTKKALLVTSLSLDTIS
jgi:hypothetical protein